MAYATQQNCIDRYGSDIVIVATDHDNNGAIDTSVLQAALDDATSTINSYVCGLPGFPFASVPDGFEKLCCDMALYNASFTANTVTEEQRKRYDDALKYLLAVAQQKIRLTVESGLNVIEANSTAEIISSERTFTRSSLSRLF